MVDSIANGRFFRVSTVDALSPEPPDDSKCRNPRLLDNSSRIDVDVAVGYVILLIIIIVGPMGFGEPQMCQMVKLDFY